MVTAVEFLLKKLLINGYITLENQEQALEMEKQQIINAYIEGYSATDYNVDSEQYYNETFKTK